MLTKAAVEADLKKGAWQQVQGGSGRERMLILELFLPLWIFLASLREKQEQAIRLSSVLSDQSHVSPPPEPPVPHTVWHESIRQRRAPPRSA